MTTSLSELTSAVCQAVRDTAGLATAQVGGMGEPPDSARLPAATIALADIRRSAADGDDLDGLWRVRFDVTLWRRDASRSGNARGLAGLAEAVIAAVLADPSQGRLAVAGPGPAGAPTEILRVEPGRGGAPPLGSLTIRLACWVIPPDGLTPLAEDEQVLIDGAELFASGPHRLAVGPWQRRRLDRRFAGLDGTVSIDLGASHRPMRLTGRLVGPDPPDLADQVAAVEALNDRGELHRVAVPDGRSFGNVRVESIRWGRLLCPGPDRTACAGYEITLAQLAEDN